jgi:glycosyltransferase involved in cell wall biosynthesis
MLVPLHTASEKTYKHKGKSGILVLCINSYPAEIGGAEIHAYYVSNELAERGHAVHVVALAPRKQVQHEVMVMFRQSFIKLWRSPFRSLAYLLKFFLLGYLQRSEYDVIQIHVALNFMIPAFLLSKISGKPYVVTCHGSEIKLLRRRVSVKWWQNILLLKASHVVAVSKEIRNILIQEYGLSSQRITLVPNGFDEDFVEQLRARSSRRIHGEIQKLAFLGNLREVKDPLTLIEAFNLISKRTENIHLEIVGDGVLRPAMERKIEFYGLRDRVTFHGVLMHERALEVLSSSDIYLSTSVSEGLPTSLIEAMALGKAVVATSVGGVPEIVVDGVNGLLTPPKLPEQTAKCVERLLDDSAFAERLRRAAVESVKDYSWSKIAEKYENIYRDIARARRE